MKLIITFILLINCSVGFSQGKSVLLLHGFLHVGNGETLPSAAIGIRNGRIDLIKNSLAFTYDKADWDTIIDLNGKHVYPGFVAPNSTLGISEIEAVRSTRDFDEVGIYNPHVRAQIAYNVESEIIATVRTNGVLICQPTPRGGVISGTSSVMLMDGWNWEDATIVANDGIHVNWPGTIQRAKENDQLREPAEKYQKDKAAIYSFFEAAKVYANKSVAIDLRYDAVKACFNEKKRVYFHADNLQQLNDIIEFVQHFGIKYPVIVGGYDSYLITRKLKDAKIPVMLYRTHSLPHREDDPVNMPYAIASKLQEGGVLFCIQNEGDMEAMNARNIPFLAGTAKAYGLTDEQAVSAISLNACKIMGIDKEYGSIEVGKSATLFVSEGNALEMKSNQLVLAMLNGKFMSLKNKQTDLYKKYEEHYKMD